MRNVYVLLVTIFLGKIAAGQMQHTEKNNTAFDKIILASGSLSNDDKSFIQYVAGLTKKSNPRICYIPTAAADNANDMVTWFTTCEDLPVRPYVMKTFLNSSPEQMTFEETLLSMDAIIVGGGNTLNMIGIWEAQGIDTVLRKAYNKGIVLAGGSAGALCWFTGGYSDSRPKQLSIINGLGFLNFSYCPHYHSEPSRKPLYFQAITEGRLKEGYASDDMAALLFVNGIFKKSVSFKNEDHNYFIRIENGQVKEELLPTEIIR